MTRTWVWVNEVAHRLARHAARGVPGALSARLEEEWSADLATLRTPLARLRFAVGCHRAAYFISREHPVMAALPAPLPAAVLPPPRFVTSLGVDADDCAFFQGAVVSYLMIAALLVGLLGVLACGVGP
jgi:hypothetical protein